MPHTDEQMEQQIQEKSLTAPRVTLDQIKEMMKRVKYKFDQPEGTTSTFAHAFLDGKFFLASGYSACVSKENFDAELGLEYAQVNAEKHAQDKLWELEGYNLYRNPMMECSTRESSKAELGEVLPEDPKESLSQESKQCSGLGSASGYNSTSTDPNLIAQLRECLGNHHIKSYGLHELVVTRLAKELGGSTDDLKVDSGAQQCANNCDTASSDALAEALKRGVGDLLPEHPWESIPTQQVLKYVGPVAFAYVWAVTNEQQDYWTCTISVNHAPEPTPSITQSGITEEVAFAAAIRTLKEIAYKNEWVLWVE